MHKLKRSPVPAGQPIKPLVEIFDQIESAINRDEKGVALALLDAIRPTVTHKQEQELIPIEVDRVLSAHSCRLYEAVAILELSSNLLVSGACDAEEQGQVIGALSAALRLLRPIPGDIGCPVSMQRAVDRMQSKGAEVANHA